MELQFIGAAHEVTGSCHFLQVGNKKILVDCGMRQGALKFENVSLPVDASKIDFVILTQSSGKKASAARSWAPRPL